MKAAKEEKERRLEREDIFSISTLFHLEFFHSYSVVRSVSLNYLRTVISPKSAIEIYLLSLVVNKSKFSVIMSSGVFMLLASACWLISSRHNPHVQPRGLGKTSVLTASSRVEESPFSLKGPVKVTVNLSLLQGQFLFLRKRHSTSCLGVSAFLWISFYFIYLIHPHKGDPHLVLQNCRLVPDKAKFCIFW